MQFRQYSIFRLILSNHAAATPRHEILKFDVTNATIPSTGTPVTSEQQTSQDSSDCDQIKAKTVLQQHSYALLRAVHVQLSESWRNSRVTPGVCMKSLQKGRKLCGGHFSAEEADQQHEVSHR